LRFKFGSSDFLNKKTN